MFSIITASKPKLASSRASSTAGGDDPRHARGRERRARQGPHVDHADHGLGPAEQFHNLVRVAWHAEYSMGAPAKGSG